ncbi:MAG: hypothetical protein K8F30_05090, partial [Taibaiella sp.]|nr:hypothetical protein [Taibaiella sp.]
MRYTTPVYQVGNEILVEDSRSSMTVSDEAQILSELGLGKSSADNINNVMRSFKKAELMKDVAAKLRLNVRYYEYGRFKTTEFYDNNPFLLQATDSVLGAVAGNYSYILIFNEDGSFKFKEKGTDNYTSGKLGKEFKLPFGVVAITKTGYPLHYGAEYELSITNQLAAARGFLGGVSLDRPDKTDNVVYIYSTDVLPQRGVDIVNTLVKAYMKANVEEKNRNADNVINFINERIKSVESELGEVEVGIETFKKEYNFTAPESQSELLYAKTSEYLRELSEMEIKLELVKALEDNVREASRNRQLVPTTLFIDNESLNRVLSEYNGLLTEREEKAQSLQEEALLLKTIDKRIAGTKALVESNLASIKEGLNVRIKELREKAGQTNMQISQVPKKERLLIEKTRQQTIKAELYLMLLKKREETAVAKAATTANVTVINEARNMGAISPNTKRIKNRALLIGFLIPMIFFSIRRLLNNKIIAKSDI